LSPASLVGRVLLGGAAAVMSLLLVAGVTGWPTTPVSIGLVAVVWTVLYSAVLLAASYPPIRGFARAAAAGAGITLVLTPVLTIPSVVEACRDWMGTAQHSASLALVMVVVAAGYTAAPLLLGVVGARTRREGGWLVDGLKLSGLYAALIAPAVYLECVALPPEVMALWMAGAVIGAGAGGPIGLRLGGWLRPAALP
jgi:hypothetical protein